LAWSFRLFIAKFDRYPIIFRLLVLMIDIYLLVGATTVTIHFCYYGWTYSSNASNVGCFIREKGQFIVKVIAGRRPCSFTFLDPILGNGLGGVVDVVIAATTNQLICWRHTHVVCCDKYATESIEKKNNEMPHFSRTNSTIFLNK